MEGVPRKTHALGFVLVSDYHRAIKNPNHTNYYLFLTWK